MRVETDSKSGFCFGVVNAIGIAEKNLDEGGRLFSLGDIVHNEEEIKRLSGKGLITISRDDFFKMSHCRVLIRAHGEPPETYQYARENNIELIEATCPVVLKLQQLVKKSYEQTRIEGGQVVIFGREGHAEISGLNGQTGNNSIIVENLDDLGKINFNKPVVLYSQTTKSIDEYQEIADQIKKRTKENVPVVVKDTICRQVANRVKHLQEFAAKFDVVVFVSGKKSSNGKFLFSVCREINPDTYLVANEQDLMPEWFAGKNSSGVCGATSTPVWLMEMIAETIRERF